MLSRRFDAGKIRDARLVQKSQHVLAWNIYCGCLACLPGIQRRHYAWYQTAGVLRVSVRRIDWEHFRWNNRTTSWISWRRRGSWKARKWYWYSLDTYKEEEEESIWHRLALFITGEVYGVQEAWNEDCLLQMSQNLRRSNKAVFHLQHAKRKILLPWPSK